MFSIFADRPNTVLSQQENNIAARKPGLTTTKTPFADRKVNANVDEASAVQTKPVKVVKETELTTPDIMDFYTCSYKDTPDLPECEDNISSVIFGNIPSTPPPKNMISSEPDFMEIAKTDYTYNYFDSIYDKIRSNNVLNKGLDHFDDSEMFQFDAVF